MTKGPLFKKKAMKAPRLDISVVPSERFQQLVAAMGGYCESARIWGLDPKTLSRFLAGEGSLSGQSVATVICRTGLKYENLFEHVHDGKGVPNGCT